MQQDTAIKKRHIFFHRKMFWGVEDAGTIPEEKEKEKKCLPAQENTSKNCACSSFSPNNHKNLTHDVKHEFVIILQQLI